MQFKKTIQIDLADRGKCETLGEAAVSGDSGARALVFALVEAGKPWPVPEGTRAALAFQTDLGSSGEYDTMPDGTDAAEIDGNLVTVRLVDEILARPGKVALSLVLRDDRLHRLSSHPVMLTVSQGLGDVPGLPSCYYRVRDLAEINEAMGELSGRVDAVDTDAVRQAAQEAREAAEAAKHHAEAVEIPETDGDTLESALVTKESAFEIHKVLHQLDEPYKEVFSLRVFGQLSYKQIGILFGKTESWARVTYHRARLKIKEELK